ncbi:MAG: hypothetical protein Q8O88_06265 [bacterium]|nr:hypothetical protein [bacterium]
MNSSCLFSPNIDQAKSLKGQRMPTFRDALILRNRWEEMTKIFRIKAKVVSEVRKMMNDLSNQVAKENGFKDRQYAFRKISVDYKLGTKSKEIFKQIQKIIILHSPN